MRLPITLTLLAFLAACGGSEKPGQAASSGDTPVARSSAEDDVAILGREIFELVDQAMSYRSSHRNRLPKSLRELGVDELTGSTSRSLAVAGSTPTVTVGFRDSSTRTLSNCRGTSAVLEEAALSGGEFSVICTLSQGGSTTLRTHR